MANSHELSFLIIPHPLCFSDLSISDPKRIVAWKKSTGRRPTYYTNMEAKEKLYYENSIQNLKTAIIGVSASMATMLNNKYEWY